MYVYVVMCCMQMYVYVVMCCMQMYVYVVMCCMQMYVYVVMSYASRRHVSYLMPLMCCHMIVICYASHLMSHDRHVLCLLRYSS